MSRKKELTGRHVLFMLLGFFGLILVANIALVYLATSSWNGVVQKQPYERGLAYDEVLAEKKELVESGWVSHVEYDPQQRLVMIDLKDKNGPVSGATGEVTFFRPVHDGEDLDVTLVPVSQPGRYQATADVPAPGLWEVRISAEKDGQSRTTRHRMDIRP